MPEEAKFQLRATESEFKTTDEIPFENDSPFGSSRTCLPWIPSLAFTRM